MRRSELEHLIRAAADIANDDELIIVGSQAILGSLADAPDELCVSNEADLYPKNRPERWELIDGTIGELSPFHETFGYYAQGVQEGTAILPQSWQERLVPVKNRSTRGATGWCLELHDLMISKYVAGRTKARRFTRAAVAHGLVQREILLERLRATEVDDARREAAQRAIELDFAAGRG